MSAPVNVYALWDQVIISPYNLGSGFGVIAVSDNQSQGTVEVIGQNVDRVSVGQLVVFTKGAVIATSSDDLLNELPNSSWQVVPQEAILVIYKPPLAP